MFLELVKIDVLILSKCTPICVLNRWTMSFAGEWSQSFSVTQKTKSYKCIVSLHILVGYLIK